MDLIGHRPLSVCAAILVALLICVGIDAHATSRWHPDILGDGYACTTVYQPADYGGDVTCTVVRHDAASNTADTLRRGTFTHTTITSSKRKWATASRMKATPSTP